jgi:pimeloyl-ACP methyl ester carboxylesterase
VGRLALLAAVAALLALPASASAGSLACSPTLSSSAREPVLLVHGTALSPKENWSWSYQRAFDAAGLPYCTVALPGHAMGDIQLAATDVRDAIRSMSAATGRKVEYVGFSQGGMIGRWVLKWWPDTRALVYDYVGIDPSNHGTLDAYPVCALGGCAPAIWQQQTGSRFLAALNAGGETFAGIDYSTIFSRTDEVVTPNLDAHGSSALHTGGGTIVNLAAQEVCPLDLSEHLAMGTYDPVAYAFVRDAIDHAGPAAPARISRAVCAAPFMPGVDPVAFPANFANVGLVAAQQVLTYPHVAREPPLQPYAAGP